MKISVRPLAAAAVMAALGGVLSPPLRAQTVYGTYEQPLEGRRVRPEPVRMLVAEFPLAKRPALIVGVPGEHSRASLALAHAASRRVPADEQLNLSGHARLQFLRDPERRFLIGTVIERAEETRAAFIKFKEWLAARHRADADERKQDSATGGVHFPSFRDWVTQQQSGPVEAP